MRLGAIADDFTGATDLAGLLARGGARVSLRVGMPDASVLGFQGADVEVVALKIRTLPKDQAQSQSKAALKWLQSQKADRFFWKYCSTFDSTDVGNIGPVSEVLMQTLGTAQTIYCPAYPENGRFVFMGHLFVGQMLLSNSSMKDHPLTPMRDANLLRLLTPQVTGEVGLIDRQIVALGVAAVQTRLAELAQKNVTHVVIDAICTDDLATIATACKDMLLITGGSALAMPWPALNGVLPNQAGLCQPLGRGALILAGSCSEMTRAQVANFAQKGPSLQLDPHDLAQKGVQNAKEWLGAQAFDAPKLIYASAAPEQVAKAQSQFGAQAAGALVEAALSELAIFARTMGYHRFLVAGGETSGAVITALGISQLDIGPEIAPGVPWTYGAGGLALALKSGNFGEIDFFSKAFGKLPSHVT